MKVLCEVIDAMTTDLLNDAITQERRALAVQLTRMHSQKLPPFLNVKY
jgi:hypothetical protein